MGHSRGSGWLIAEQILSCCFLNKWYFRGKKWEAGSEKSCANRTVNFFYTYFINPPHTSVHACCENMHYLLNPQCHITGAYTVAY